MISIILQGVSPVLPVFVIIILLLFSVAVSWWSYQHLTAIAPWKKWGLISLRAASLAILVLLLLNPFITVEVEETESPRIAVYLDDSQSLGIERGEYQGLTSYQSIKDELKETETGDFEYEYFLFSEEVQEGDDIEALGANTNLNRVIEHISQNEGTFRASVLISDGIFTQGRNPVFAAQRLSSPVITIPAGDTSTVRDILIADVNYSEPAYTNSMHRFTADIQQIGFEDEETAVQFLIDNEIVESKNISFSTQSGSHQVEFFHEFTEPGFYNLEINVPVKDDEFTDRNNNVSFTLEAIDDKTRILSLSFEIYPDISAIRKLIATDQQNELVSSTYLGDGNFIGDDPRTAEEDFDLVVLHGLPEPDSEMLEWLNQQRFPVVYIATPTSAGRTFDTEYSELISLRQQELNSLLDVHIDAAQNISHPIMETEQAVMSRFPTLKTYQGNYSTSPVAEVLLNAQFQRNSTDIPLLVAEDTQVRRLISVNAFGWYRYELSRNDEATSFFDQLFTNITGWASTPSDRRTLTLEPAKSSFTERETVEIRATLVNERGEPEPEGLLELYFFENEENEPRVFRMNHRESGNYQAEIGSYPQGIYRVEAVAQKNDREIGRAATRVTISQSSAELVNTKRDDDLLERLAEVTGGFFLSNYQFESIHSFLAEQNLDEVSTDVSDEFIYTFEAGWWFFIVILLLSGEWILRRTISLP